MDDFISFTFDSKQIQVTMLDYEPWFVLENVCKILEIQKKKAFDELDFDEKNVLFEDCEYPEYKQEIISESGLYSLIFRSDKQNAKRFKRWVLGEMMPIIRQEEPTLNDEKMSSEADQATCRLKAIDDSFTEFAKFHILPGKGEKYSVRSDILYRSYVYWCALNDFSPLTAKKFFDRFNIVFRGLFKQRKIAKKCIEYSNIILLKDDITE
jgi:prophage antirepressor-like protein